MPSEQSTTNSERKSYGGRGFRSRDRYDRCRRSCPAAFTPDHCCARRGGTATAHSTDTRRYSGPCRPLSAHAGLYQMYLPHSLGGFELPPVTVFEAIEELSKADGSVGWCLMNANGIALGAGWLAPDVGKRMFGEPANLRAAGSLRPQGARLAS